MTEQVIPTGVQTDIVACCTNLDDGAEATGSDNVDPAFIQVADDGTYHYTLAVDWEIANPATANPRDTAIMRSRMAYYAADGFGLGDCPFDNPYGIYRYFDDAWTGTCVPVTGGGDTMCGAGPDQYNADEIALTWGRVSDSESDILWDTMGETASGSFSFVRDAEADSSSATLHCLFSGWVEIRIMVEMRVGFPAAWCEFWPPIGATLIPRFDNQWVQFDLRDQDDTSLLPHCRVHWADTDSVNNVDPISGDPPDPNWTSNQEFVTAIITGTIQVTDGTDLHLVAVTNAQTGFVVNKAHGFENERHSWVARRVTPPEVEVRFTVCDSIGDEEYQWDKATTAGWNGATELSGEVALTAGQRVQATIKHDAGSGPVFNVMPSTHLDLHPVNPYTEPTLDCEID